MAKTNFRHTGLIMNTALPYVTNTSPVDDTKSYVDGSNVLTSYRAYAERRPGFPTYTADNFGAGTSITRWFDWQKWDGTFYIIMCVTNASSPYSKVYKQKVGTDATFVLIHTDATSSEPFDFVVSHNFLFFGNATDMKKYDGTTVTDWGYSGPSAAPTIVNAAAGNVPSAIGHSYVAAYGTSATGYITDISDPSALTGTANRQWDVTVGRCTNTNCDEVHFYRTEDGGGVWRELSNSPMANPGAGSATIRDNNSDDNLQDTQAPMVGVNAKPSPGYGVIFWQGRLWWVKNDTLYWTGYEEITNGFRPESAPTDNNRKFGKPLTGLVVAGVYLLVVAANEVFRYSGDSLATFTLEGSIKKYGSRNRATLCSDKKQAYWLDSSNTVVACDAVNVKDISIPIQPDIDTITHASASMTVHADGKRRWLVLADGGAGKLRVFDLSMNRWMPPWPVTNIQSIYSGEVAAGSVKLFLGRNSKPLAASNTAYQDEGVAYTAYVITNLSSICFDSNPTIYGVLEYVGIERNSVALSDIGYLIDEDPASGSYTTILTNEQNPAGRSASTALVEKWYWTKLQTAGRRASIRIDWAAANTNFKLYSIDPAFRVGPGGAA